MDDDKHKPKSVVENDTHKSRYHHFDIHTDRFSSARRPDLVLINKKKRTGHLVDFAVSVEYSAKIKKKRKDIQIFGGPSRLGL